MLRCDAVVIGSGPNGIACAVHLERAGLRAIVLERGRLLESFQRYPAAMRFSSTREKMTIPGHPFVAPPDVKKDDWPGAWPVELNPSRDEAIAYYVGVVERLGLLVRTRRRVVAVDRAVRSALLDMSDGTVSRFAVTADVADDDGGGAERYLTDFVVVATGSFDAPTRLGVSGEDLPHVSHYFLRAADYAAMSVVVVGGTSSALETALACRVAGARVTLVHRRDGLYASPTFKSPPRDTVAAMVQSGEIRAFAGACVREIVPGAVALEPVSPQERAVRIPPMNTSQAVADPTGPIGALAPDHTIIRLGQPIERALRIPADAVLLMTGYRADRALLRAAGVAFNPDNGEPVWDRETCETNIPGLYVVGAAGNPEGTGNRVGITSGLPQAARAMAALAAAAAARRRPVESY